MPAVALELLVESMAALLGVGTTWAGLAISLVVLVALVWRVRSLIKSR